MAVENPTVRTLLMAIAAAGVVVIFLGTEKMFNDADLKNAIKMVETLRSSPSAPSIPEAIMAEPGASRQISWSAELRDRVYGFVHVTGVTAVNGESRVYEFDVNIAGQRLHPGNELSRALMKQLGHVEEAGKQ